MYVSLTFSSAYGSLIFHLYTYVDNEDEELFCRTFTSVIKVSCGLVPIKGASYLYSVTVPNRTFNTYKVEQRVRRGVKTPGRSEWLLYWSRIHLTLPCINLTLQFHRIVVCIVSDGRMKINQRTLKVIGLYGAYQDGIAKDTVGMPVSLRTRFLRSLLTST